MNLKYPLLFPKKFCNPNDCGYAVKSSRKRDNNRCGFDKDGIKRKFKCNLDDCPYFLLSDGEETRNIELTEKQRSDEKQFINNQRRKGWK